MISSKTPFCAVSSATNSCWLGIFLTVVESSGLDGLEGEHDQLHPQEHDNMFCLAAGLTLTHKHDLKANHHNQDLQAFYPS
jgi:hypothetical protein